MPPRKKPEILWDPTHREKMLAPVREKKRLRKQAYRARKRAEAAAAEDGPPVTKKARVEGVDGTGKEPIETNTADTTERRHKTATKSDKPAEVRTTRRARAKDETTNGKEGKETEDKPDDILNPTSAVLPSGEGRTSRRRNKKTKEPAANKASTQALETGLAKDTDDIMVIAADKAPTSIALANGTEGEGKISTEDISATQGHKHAEVVPQAAQSVPATSCLVNQPLIVNVFNINENNVNQRGSGLYLNATGNNSIISENVLTSIKSSLEANQQGCAAYGQPTGWVARPQSYEVADQINIAQEDACYTDETQVQTSHEEEHGIEPIQGQLSDDTSTNTTQETSVSATARISTSDTAATTTQDAGTT